MLSVVVYYVHTIKDSNAMALEPKNTLGRRLNTKHDVDVFVAEIARCDDVGTARNILLDYSFALMAYLDKVKHMPHRRRRLSVMSKLDIA